MALPTATSASAIRMGLRIRMPMAIRRAIRCGVQGRPSALRGSPFFNGRLQDKFFSLERNRRTDWKDCPTFFGDRDFATDTIIRGSRRPLLPELPAASRV